MGKPAICIGENKDAEAARCLCFRYTDSTIPLLLKSEISSFLPSSVTVQPGLCRTWSETQIVSFLTHRLNINSILLGQIFLKICIRSLDFYDALKVCCGIDFWSFEFS